MKKVIVGLSGGVDSAVSAYLLKKEGYEVIGVTYKTLEDFDVKEAETIAKKLGIEFHYFDVTKDFKEEIINSFIKDYENGLTPNPCVLCNKKIKFKYLYESLKKYNADYIATGHYAKIIDNKLYKGDDIDKDQSYFLYGLDKDILKRIIFPLNNLSKKEVKEIAIKEDLISPNKKESYDVCFIKDSFKEYVKENMLNKKGEIINIDSNEVIGYHNGLSYYTIGQRKGLNIGGLKEKIFVVGKDIKKNVLYVGEKDSNDYLLSDSCIIDNINFNCDLRPIKCHAKFRFRQKDVPVTLEYLEDKILVKYENQRAITPGQACVLYVDDMCIGGGVIEEVRKDGEKLWCIN